MLIRKGFKFRIYPSEAQIAILLAWETALRFLWNLALEQWHLGLARPRCERRYPSAFDQINEMTELRALLPWLADVPRNICAQLLVELDKAWQRCFKKIARAPRWKRRGRESISFCETHHEKWHIDGDVLHFPKLGPMRIVVHRSLEGKQKSCTIVREGDQWFACISCEVEIDDPAPRVDPVVALDRGVVNIVGDSDGSLIEAPRFYEKSLRRLAHAQRTVSRRKKGSKNREKAQIRVVRLHRKVRRQREHFLHQISHDYAKSHGTVVIEKLHVMNLVHASSDLSRGILDAGWSILASMLRYKLAWSGGQLVEVRAAYSSQTCSSCGCCDERNRVSQSVFRCIACGHTEHADLNAPKVLKSRWRPSALPVEGSAPEAALRSRKSVKLRVPRRSTENLS